MTIETVGGFLFPHKTPALNPTVVTYREDFFFSVNPLGKPEEIAGAGGFAFSSALVDPNHPGIYEADMSANGTVGFQNYFGANTTQGEMVLSQWETIDLEWLWLFTSFGAMTQFSCMMGINSNNSACSGATNSAGFGFKQAGGAVCTFLNTADRFIALSDQGGTSTQVNTGVAVSPLLNTWIKCNLQWNKAANTFTYLLNGTNVATINNNIPLNQTQPAMFGFITNATGVPGAGVFFRFDYLNFTGTVAR